MSWRSTGHRGASARIGGSEGKSSGSQAKASSQRVGCLACICRGEAQATAEHQRELEAPRASQAEAKPKPPLRGLGVWHAYVVEKHRPPRSISENWRLRGQ